MEIKKIPQVLVRYAQIPARFYESIQKFNPNFLRMQDNDIERYNVYDEGRDYLFMVGRSLEFIGVRLPPALLGVASDSTELNYQLLKEFSESTGAKLFPSENDVQAALERLLSLMLLEVRKEGGMKCIKEIAEFHQTKGSN